jgi:hypothetical protein
MDRDGIIDNVRLEKLAGFTPSAGISYHTWSGAIKSGINGILRRYFPNKHNWRLTTQKKIDKVVSKINPCVASALEMEKGCYMKITELRNREDQIAKKIAGILPANGVYPVIDGIIDVERYWSSKYKILWILKEANYGGKNSNEGENLCCFYRDIEKDSPKIQTHLTIKRVMNATHRILSNLEPLEAFKSIACINIKKIPGSKKSSESEIKKAYDQNRVLLFEQIEVYNPDIIICGNALQYFKEYFEPVLNLSKKKSIGMGERHYFCTKERLYINAYHPANWHRITTEQYCKNIYDAFSYWKKEYRN